MPKKVIKADTIQSEKTSLNVLNSWTGELSENASAWLSTEDSTYELLVNVNSQMKTVVLQSTEAVSALDSYLDGIAEAFKKSDLALAKTFEVESTPIEVTPKENEYSAQLNG